MGHGYARLIKDLSIGPYSFKGEDYREGLLTAFLPEQPAFAVWIALTPEQKQNHMGFNPWVTFNIFVDFNQYFKITDCTDQVSCQYNTLLVQNGFEPIAWVDDRDNNVQELQNANLSPLH